MMPLIRLNRTVTDDHKKIWYLQPSLAKGAPMVPNTIWMLEKRGVRRSCAELAEPAAMDRRLCDGGRCTPPAPAKERAEKASNPPGNTLVEQRTQRSVSARRALFYNIPVNHVGTDMIRHHR